MRNIVVFCLAGQRRGCSKASVRLQNGITVILEAHGGAARARAG